MKTEFTLLYLLPFMMYACSHQEEQAPRVMEHVDTMIGTGAHFSEDAAGLWGTVRKQKPLPTSKRGTMAGYDQAHDPGQCIPAVLAPHGMNFWVAQTEDTEQKGIAPYYYADEEIQGFRGSHWIVGSMTQDYGSFTLMPIAGDLKTNPLERGSRFSHDAEVSTPAYYSVTLEDYGIQAEMTATSRSAIFRFTYQQAGDAYLVVNPNSDFGEGSITVDAANCSITGSNPVHRIYQGWGEYAGFDGHFAVQLDRDILDYGTYKGDSINDQGAWVKFHVEAGETVLVKAASSFTDTQHAQQNLAQEIPDWDFDRVHSQLEQTWLQTLGKIDVESHNDSLLTSFYTALYHASFLPREFNDCDGSYPKFASGQSICHTDGTYYEDYSMWDTYRAMHPLLCLIDPDRAGDMIQSLLDKYKQGGWLPIFPCWNSYTSEMIGDHCASLVADAWFKGVRNFDQEEALQALLKNAFEQPDTFADYEQGKGRRALQDYMQLGFIPVENPVAEAYHKAEQTSRTLEYAYDDYVLARFAEDQGRDSVAAILYARAKNYKNVYNPELGWMDGRHEDGTFVGGNPYDFQKYICEGKPCHYTWYVPHDIPGLMELMGGELAFVQKLDTLFESGAYWHGNEPCHQIAWLYDYTSQPWKTQRQIRRIMQEEYGLSADGLAGNDDAGQMSAWYLFAAMGLYPVCPGVPEYALSSPAFDRITLHLDNGKDFTIEARNLSDENIYIQRALLNGQEFPGNFLCHSDILQGGSLVLEMGPKHP